MNKALIYLTVVIAIVGASVGGYYVVTQTHLMRVELPAPPPPVDQSATQPKPKPNHGNFEQRFQPKPPPPDGGASKE